MASLLSIMTNLLLLTDEQFNEYKREINTIQSVNPTAYTLGVSLIDIRENLKN